MSNRSLSHRLRIHYNLTADAIAEEAADRIEALEECLRALIVDITHSDHSPHDWSEQVVIAQARALLEE